MKQEKLNSTAQPLAFSVGTFNLLGQKHINKKGRISRFTHHSLGHHFKICKKNNVELTNTYRLTIEGLGWSSLGVKPFFQQLMMQNTISDPQWNKKNWIPQLNPWHFLLGLSTDWDKNTLTKRDLFQDSHTIQLDMISKYARKTM